jgi:AhpD family alkylhydroperoxidase
VLPGTVPFTDHTIESAPPAARRVMTGIQQHLGYLPAAVGRWAESPELLDGFQQVQARYESSTLDQLSREVLIMTIATRNGCHLCVAMHTARLTGMNADPALISELRDGPGAIVSDPRLDALRRYTLRVVEQSGDVDDAALGDFLAHGYTTRNALEVVLGIAAYTLSTLANRLTRAPLDAQLAQFA